MNHKNDPVEQLTAKAFAKELGVSDLMIRAWLAQRRISYHKIGRAVRIPRTELERLLAESLIPARPQR
jgi:excisionase family DNA binding protein